MFTFQIRMRTNSSGLKNISSVTYINPSTRCEIYPGKQLAVTNDDFYVII